MAENKFTLLRYSYSSLRWGLLLSIAVFIIIKTVHFLFPHTSVAFAEVVVDPKLHIFKKIYEPSGVISLADGRLIVIEDEASRAFHVMDIDRDGQIIENVNMTQTLMKAFSTKLNDIEAITLGPDGFVYAITSHQRNSGGERSPNREQFIRFKIEANNVTEVSNYGKLLDVIDESGILGEVDEQGNGGIVNINIEALSFNQEGQLMLGFRAPLSGEKTIIGILKNPKEVFESDVKPVISTSPLLLDLHGDGIRAMTYDTHLNGYLISNEVYRVDRGEKSYSQLLFWDGVQGHRVHQLNSPGLENVEGISPIGSGDEKKLLLVSDNGKKNKGKSANYLYLTYKDLSNK